MNNWWNGLHDSTKWFIVVWGGGTILVIVLNILFPDFGNNTHYDGYDDNTCIHVRGC